MIGIYELAMQRNPEIGESLNMQPSSLKVRAAALISGMFYTARMDSVGGFLRQDFYGSAWRRHPFCPYMNPDVPEVAGNLPPLCLVTSKLDNLRGYTLKFAKGLKTCRKDYILVDKPAHAAMTHDFVIIKPEGEQAQQVINGICEFFQNT